MTKKSRKILFTGIAGLLLTGCAFSEPTFTPDGKQGYSIDCSGGDSSWGECYEEAGELCGRKGYRILEKMGDKQSNIFADEDMVSSTTSYTRSMLIQCK